MVSIDHQLFHWHFDEIFIRMFFHLPSSSSEISFVDLRDGINSTEFALRVQIPSVKKSRICFFFFFPDALSQRISSFIIYIDHLFHFPLYFLCAYIEYQSSCRKFPSDFVFEENLFLHYGINIIQLVEFLQVET